MGLQLKTKHGMFFIKEPPKEIQTVPMAEPWEMTCLILQSLRNETRNISLESFPLDDILQMPSQGWVHLVVLGCCGLLLKLVTSSKRRLGHLGESSLFVLFCCVVLRKIILMEALFARITSEVLLKLHFQKTHIGLVYLTKRAIFSPFLWCCLCLAKGRPIFILKTTSFWN